MKLANKAQSTIEVLMGIPITLIGLVVVFIMLDPIGQILFDTLDTANSTVITNINAIKLIVGIIGLIVAIMAVMKIVNSFRSQPQYPGGMV